MKMQPTIKTTNKLHFRKWLYKIVLTTPSVSYVKRYNILGLRTLSDTGYHFNKGSRERAISNRDNLLKIGFFLEDSATKFEFQTRAEGSSLSIFTNDETFVDLVLLEMKEYVTEYCKPLSAEYAKFLSNNKNKVICNELPNGLFKYKIYLGTSEKIPDNVKTGFLNWSKNYGSEKIHLPESTYKTLSGSSHNWYSWGQYFYISDSKMLSLALMYIGPYVSKTEEYVLKSDVI